MNGWEQEFSSYCDLNVENVISVSVFSFKVYENVGIYICQLSVVSYG